MSSKINLYIWIYVNIYPTRESKEKNKSKNQCFKLLMWKHWLLKYFVIRRDSVILTSMCLDRERKPKGLKRTHKHPVPAENLRSMRPWFLNSSANKEKSTQVQGFISISTSKVRSAAFFFSLLNCSYVPGLSAMKCVSEEMLGRWIVGVASDILVAVMGR